MAGGLRPDAGKTLKLTRQATRGPIPLPTSALQTKGDVTVAEINVEELVRGKAAFADIEVQPHDVISVSQADLVYVVGKVRKPGGFVMTGSGDFTVLQALSMAEGLDKTAAGKKAVILRKEGEMPVLRDLPRTGEPGGSVKAAEFRQIDRRRDQARGRASASPRGQVFRDVDPGDSPKARPRA